MDQDLEDGYFHDHTSILVGDNVYIWGGNIPTLPKVHSSPEKRQLLSSVGVFNVLNATFVKRPTIGTPPNGAMRYGSCCVGDDIYYFGGRCNHSDCYHNDLLVLNTKSYKWRQIDCNNGPMEKSGCGMIPFSINGEDFILLIGGCGPLPSNKSPHAQYTPTHRGSPECLTNEVHIMCVSTTPGKWTVPRRNGSAFPPSEHFSIDTLPGNRAIVFGGRCIKERNKSSNYSNDVFIVSYTNDVVDFQRLDCSSTNISQPEGRWNHSSVVISSVSGNGEEKHYLLVLGGLCGLETTGDCWLMEITTGNNQWKQISLPDEVVTMTPRYCHSLSEVTWRYDHSMSCYNMSDHCKWLIVSGGDSISSPKRLMIVELVFSPADDNWTVTNVLNEEVMKNTTKLVFDCLSKQQERRGGERLVQLLKQQLKQKEQEMISELSLVQRRLEDEKRAHNVTRQKKSRELHEKDNAEKDKLLQRNHVEIQRKEASIQQQQQEMKEKINNITKQQDQKYMRLNNALQTKLDGKERELNVLKTRIDDEIKRYKLLQMEKDVISQEMKDMVHRLKVDDLSGVMLFIAYIQHQWEELGRVLRVPSSELQRIASKDCTVTRKLYDTLRYWIVWVGGSLKGLVDALKHKDIGQQELADTIDCDHAKIRKRQTVLLKDHKLITQYNDLSPYNIFPLVDWMVFGMVLGLDDDTLEQIDASHSIEELTRARVMVERWISTGQAYWSILVDALDSPIFGESELANQIAKDEMGTYKINEATVEEVKEKIYQKLTNAASILDRQPKGIIYAFVMTEVKGARVDLTTITDTFEKELMFAVYPVEDINGAELANLIKAAATYDYPLSCKHICFYFAGHGGIKDKRPFFKPVADKDGGELFFIRENVLAHFGKKSRPKDKFIFFFDCCLNQSVNDKTPVEAGFSLEPPVRCLIAYATAIGEKSYGDTENGGRWTSTLCENLKEQVELGEALAKTHNEVMKISGNRQPPKYSSCIGPVYLKGMPEKQASTTNKEESKNILRRHRSELYETLHNNPTDLTRLATALSMDGIIDQVLEDEVVRCKGRKKEVVGKFLDKLELKADKQPTYLARLFEKMAHFNGSLRAIAQVLGEEASNDKDLEITTDLFEDLNRYKAEINVLKQKLEELDSGELKQKQVAKNGHDYSHWKDKMTSVVSNIGPGQVPEDEVV